MDDDTIPRKGDPPSYVGWRKPSDLSGIIGHVRGKARNGGVAPPPGRVEELARFYSSPLQQLLWRLDPPSGEFDDAT